MTIEWDYPEARGRFDRILAELIGPGATRAEIILVLGVGILAGFAQISYQYFAVLDWNLIQLAIAGIMAFDIAGGLVANSTSTAKRWFHRAEKGRKDHIGFVLIHAVYPILISIFFLSYDWNFFFVVFGYLSLASILVVMSPLYLRRPVSVTLFALGLLISMYILNPIPGLEWFVPLLYLKLIIGHIVREEPYRPN